MARECVPDGPSAVGLGQAPPPRHPAAVGLGGTGLGHLAAEAPCVAPAAACAASDAAFEEAARRSLGSIRFLGWQQAVLARDLARRDVELKAEGPTLDALWERLQSEELLAEERASRLAEAEARLRGLETESAQRALDRWRELDGREAQLRAALPPLRPPEGAASTEAPRSSPREERSSPAPRPRDAEERAAEAELAQLDDRRQEAALREASLRCLECTWASCVVHRCCAEAGIQLQAAEAMLEAVRGSVAERVFEELLCADPRLRRVCGKVQAMVAGSLGGLAASTSPRPQADAPPAAGDASKAQANASPTRSLGDAARSVMQLRDPAQKGGVDGAGSAVDGSGPLPSVSCLVSTAAVRGGCTAA